MAPAEGHGSFIPRRSLELATRCLLAAIGLALAAGPARAAPGGDVIGVPTSYVTRAEDTLLDLARSYDVGYAEIRAANPGVDPWLPGEGTRVVLPTRHIVPDAPRRGIVINLPELRLYYFPAQGAPMTFPVGIGSEGMETPVGTTHVARKQVHPAWMPTKSEREEDPTLPAVVPPGPDNPMGDYALYLAMSGYAIHGSNRPYSIGRRDSHGCIRMYPEDIETLFRMVAPGTPVTIVDQQAKVGRLGGELYLEIHASQSQADALVARGVPATPGEVDADDLAIRAAGADAGRLDWYAMHLAEGRRDGIPVQITRPGGVP